MRSWLSRFIGAIWFWLYTTILPGIAGGLGLAWAEKHWGWSPRTAGRILLGVMVLAGATVLCSVYFLAKEGLEQDD